jgi:hypothetical protein
MADAGGRGRETGNARVAPGLETTEFGPLGPDVLCLGTSRPGVVWVCNVWAGLIAPLRECAPAEAAWIKPG